MRGLMLTAVAAGLAAAAPAWGADWPRFLGPDGTGISPETGLNKDWRSKPPREIWRVPLGDRGYAGPSVADGRVYIIDHEGSRDIVRAFDLETGGERWRFAYEDASKHNYGFARATPTYDEGRLYTLSRMGRLHCLEARTGRKLWLVDLEKELGGSHPRWHHTASPVVDGRALLVLPGGKRGLAAALEKTTGRVLWRGAGTEKPGYAPVVKATIGGRRQYVIFSEKHVLGCDPASGRLLWRHRWETRYDVNAATPRVIGDLVFITSNYKRGCALLQPRAGRSLRERVSRTSGPEARSGARVVWENKQIQSHFSSPVVWDGHLYSTTDPGRLVCMDPRTGRVVWEHRGFEKGGLCAVDGTLIVCDGKTGEVAMVELTPRRYNELGRIRPLGGQSWTPPVVAHGRLLVRNKRAMACLDLR